MKSVKRYDGKIEHCDNGGYVTFADYKKLEARLENATGREMKLKSLIVEQQAVIDQRNGECERLINELAALREQKPVAYSYRYAGCETCDGFQDWRDELSSERPPEWMIETGKVTELQYLFKGPAPVAVPLELLAAMEEVIRISDREHEAWHRAKAAIEVLRLNSGSKSDDS